VVMERDPCRKALDGLSDGLHFVDRDRVIRYGNGDAERFVGFNKMRSSERRAGTN
jgi:hypothetical protein